MHEYCFAVIKSYLLVKSTNKKDQRSVWLWQYPMLYKQVIFDKIENVSKKEMYQFGKLFQVFTAELDPSKDGSVPTPAQAPAQ